MLRSDVSLVYVRVYDTCVLNMFFVVTNVFTSNAEYNFVVWYVRLHVRIEHFTAWLVLCRASYRVVEYTRLISEVLVAINCRLVQNKLIPGFLFKSVVEQRFEMSQNNSLLES